MDQAGIDTWIPYGTNNVLQTGISITYNPGLPWEREDFLLEKYNSFITNCRYIEAHYQAYDISHMLVHKENVLSELLVFGIKGNTAVCFNSLTKISRDVMAACMRKLFEENPGLRKIKVVASYSEYDFNLSIAHFKSDDYILQLPPTTESYHLELGPRVRKHLKQRKDKLNRNFASVCFVLKYKNDIDEASFNKIIELNKERMQKKGKIPGIDEEYSKNLYRFVQSYGSLICLELDGIIVAGGISTVINKDVFLHVIAHDNNYSKYNVGEVCAFHCIENSIEKGYSAFHFLWGESELKKRLLAKPHLLYFYVVYKSYSPGYVLGKIRNTGYNILVKFKRSELATPVRKLATWYNKRANK